MDRFIISIGCRLISLAIRINWYLIKTCVIAYYTDEDPFHSNNRYLNLLILLGQIAVWGFIVFRVIVKLS